MPRDSPSTLHWMSFRQRMIGLAVILVVIVFVGSEIWVSRYGPQITNEVVAAYSILAVFGFVVAYLYWRSKYPLLYDPPNQSKQAKNHKDDSIPATSLVVQWLVWSYVVVADFSSGGGGLAGAYTREKDQVREVTNVK